MLKGCRQLLVVTSSKWTDKQATLQLYERVNATVWTSVGDSLPVTLGREGLAWGIGLHSELSCKKEGDGKSPAGIFSLGRAFGRASLSEMNQLKIDYFQLNPYLEAVDDPHSCHYNTIVDCREVARDWKSSEKMSIEPLYELGIEVNHNLPNPQRGGGSALFFHVWHDQDFPTAGCTAMSRENLYYILSWLDREKNPMLVQLPLSQYREVQVGWNLP